MKIKKLNVYRTNDKMFCGFKNFRKFPAIYVLILSVLIYVFFFSWYQRVAVVFDYGIFWSILLVWFE